MRPLLNTTDVAAALGCPRWHVTRLIRQRELPAIDISSGPGRPTWRVEPDALERFVEVRRTPRLDRRAPRA